MIHTDFDPEKTAVIEPSEFYHPMENMPEALIGVFSRPLTEKYAAEFHGEVIMQYQDCNGGEPVYRCTAPNGTVFALMCMRVGAPSACGIMEEMIPHGVKKTGSQPCRLRGNGSKYDRNQKESDHCKYRAG